tara:strand:+ start:525 stop:818 length:294 start_codon:yes stop_codon:yes gene_type:complete
MLRAKLNQIDSKIDFLMSGGFNLNSGDMDALVNARENLSRITYAISLDADLFDVLPAAVFICKRIHEECGNSSYGPELQPLVNELIKMVEEYEIKYS